MSTTTVLPELMKKGEVAAACRISCTTLCRWSREGKFPRPRRVGGQVMWDRAVVLRFLEGCAPAEEDTANAH